MFVLCFHHGVLGVSRSLVFVYRPDGNFQLIIDTAKIQNQKAKVKCFGIYFLTFFNREVDFMKHKGD